MNHKARCKKCNADVLYTWRTCPYCNSKQFVRISGLLDIDLEWPFFIIKWPQIFLKDGWFTGTIFLLWYLFLLFLWISKSLYKIWDPVSDTVGKVLAYIAFIGSPILICWVLVYLADTFLFFIIQPLFHVLGKKVSIQSVAINNKYPQYYRRNAIKHLTDQKTLIYIVTNDTDSDLRIAAVEKLIDQIALADLAIHDTDCCVRLAAADKLTDQTMAQEAYTDIAKNGKVSIARLKATEKLIDQTIAQEAYTDIAKNDKGCGARLTAADKLIDPTIAQEVYADIAKKDAFGLSRINAIHRLTDQSVLVDIAKNSKYSDVRMVAVKKITTQSGLIEVAKFGNYCDACEEAIDRITDKDMLVNIAQINSNSSHDWDGCFCKRCGETRDMFHSWDGGCFCKRCRKSREHDWDGCYCTRCKAESHNWEIRYDYELITCSRCGKEEKRGSF